MKTLRYLLVVLVLVGSSCKTTKKKEERVAKPKTSAVTWQTSGSLSPVLDEAAGRDQLVFLDVYTNWCLPCKMMDQDVFSNKQMGRYLSDNFVCYKVNAEKENGPDLAFLYEVRVYPTLLWLDTKGRVVQRHEGAASHTQLRQLSEEAIRKHSSPGQ